MCNRQTAFKNFGSNYLISKYKKFNFISITQHIENLNEGNDKV